MAEIFFNLAVVLSLAAVGGILARKLKLPALLGYVAAGIGLTWWSGGPHQEIRQLTEFMGRMGVTLLLFLAGLELPLPELKKTGRTAVAAGLGQILICGILGFFVTRFLGFDQVTSMFLGLALTFGSTIMVIKLLSEKGDLQSLYGKITISYLLVQDFVAVGLLVFLSERQVSLDWIGIGRVILKGLVMVVAAIWLSENLMGRIFNYIARSTELVFIAAIGWCLMVAALVAAPVMGFSLEIGGFLAGLALASVPEQAQIISRVKPLRDFFLTWFFIALGSSISWGHMGGLIFPGIVMAIFVLVVNPAVVMLFLGRLGYTSRVLFMAGLAIGQLSEFSLILVANAVRVGYIRPEIMSLVTVVGVGTMAISTFLIWNSGHLYTKFKKILTHLERKTGGEITEEHSGLTGHIVLFGHNRVGSRIRPVLTKAGFDVVVVDFNPEVVEKLKKEKVKAVYGDMADHELYSRLGLHQAKMIISTVPDILDNLHLIKGLKTSEKEGDAKHYLLMTAADEEDAARLYQAGADYVLLPMLVGGDYLAHIFEYRTTSGKMDDFIKHLETYLTRHRDV